MMEYNFRDIEDKWQRYWRENKSYKSEIVSLLSNMPFRQVNIQKLRPNKILRVIVNNSIALDFVLIGQERFVLANLNIINGHNGFLFNCSIHGLIAQRRKQNRLMS